MLELKEYENIPISSFDQKGFLVYTYKKGSLIYWDVCSCLDYLYEEEKDDRPSCRKNKTKKSIKLRYEEGVPIVGPLGELLGKYDYLVYYSALKKQLNFVLVPLTPSRSLDPKSRSGLAPLSLLVLAMFKPSISYDAEFPPLKERTINQTRMIHKVRNPIRIDVEGHSKTVTQGEVVLNW